MSKRILLTGGTGFVGSYLAHRLLQEEYNIIFLVRRHKSQSAKTRVKEALRFIDSSFQCENQYEVIEGDVVQPHLGIESRQIQRLQGQIDEVWHCAASTSFREEESDKTHKNNVGGTKNVLEFMAKTKIPRLHYLSTAFVCGNRLGRVYEDELDCGQKFRNPYEKTKFEAEKSVRKSMAKKNCGITIYRLSIVVGDSCNGRTPSFTGYYTFMRGFYVLRKKIKQRLMNHSAGFEKSGIFAKDGMITVPARIPCFPKGTINIANIDYATDIIYRLSGKEESVGKTFHVAHQNAPPFEWLFNTSTKILGITGFQLIDIKNLMDMTNYLPGSSTCDILRKIESDMLYASGEYLPYISGAPIFDDTNVQHLLGNTAHPNITKHLLKRLLTYATNTDFGKKANLTD